MRRNFSIGCLCFAWLCANGALWNVVQVIGWVKMFHDYSENMSASKALEITFDGSAPCKLCRFSQAAENTARQQLPHESHPENSLQKIWLAPEDAAPVWLATFDFSWPGVTRDAGLTHIESVPVPPPRNLS